jgi:hypothetical protein
LIFGREGCTCSDALNRYNNNRRKVEMLGSRPNNRSLRNFLKITTVTIGELQE